MKSKLLLVIFCLFNVLVSTLTLAQTCPCSVSANPCASDATTLLGYLTPGSPTYVSSGIITICDTINLGEIDPSFFPLTVPVYVTLQGDYNFFNYNAGIHSGTTLKFPYLYKYGKQCGQQFTNASNTIPGGDNNGYNDELINTLPNYNTSAPPGAMPGSTPYIGAIIFKLMQGAQLKNLCIVDMNNDTLKITHAQGKKRTIINKTN